jgi:hypothetical protein
MRWVSGVRVSAVLFSTVVVFQAAADSTSFYTSMLHRGIASYDKGQYMRAANELRIAAFGLLDDVPQYETAQLYLIVLGDKLRQPDDSRAAARKLASAERVQAAYLTLTTDSAVKREAAQLLPTLLTAEELALVPAFSAAAARGTKNWNEILDLYSDIRTRRRLSHEETATFLSALVQTGRLSEAASMRTLLPPSVLSSPSVVATLSKVPPAAIGAPMASASTPGNGDVAAQLREAEAALLEARFGAARQIYLRLSQQNSPSRAVSLEIARGLHRTSAIKESTALYQRLYPLKLGEEPHMFAEAVNRYELGDFPTARLLAGRTVSLPRTAEMTYYLPRIESGR